MEHRVATLEATLEAHLKECHQRHLDVKAGQQALYKLGGATILTGLSGFAFIIKLLFEMLSGSVI